MVFYGALFLYCKIRSEPLVFSGILSVHAHGMHCFYCVSDTFSNNKVEGAEVTKMKPLLLHYYLTNRCNSKCIFCDIWSETPKVDAQEEDVLRNLYSARKNGCKFVDFTGGEPLLHKSLPVFLSEAKKLNFVTSVTTNCILFKQRAHELDNLVDLLHFSIDSDIPEQHNKLRGVESYTAVLESIQTSKKYRLVPDLLFTYTNDNIDHVEGVYRLARENKLMLLLDPVFDPWTMDSISRATHEKALIFSKRPGVYLNRAHLALRSSGGNHVRDSLCKAVDSTIVILPDNTLALPCFHHRSTLLPVNHSITEILNSDPYKRERDRQGKYSFCEGCHINCYFDPSYNFLRNRLTILSLRAKFKYSWTKYVVYRRPIPGNMIRFSANKSGDRVNGI